LDFGAYQDIPEQDFQRDFRRSDGHIHRSNIKKPGDAAVPGLFDADADLNLHLSC
jgi:hypothetical protein